MILDPSQKIAIPIAGAISGNANSTSSWTVKQAIKDKHGESTEIFTGLLKRTPRIYGDPDATRSALHPGLLGYLWRDDGLPSE